MRSTPRIVTYLEKFVLWAICIGSLGRPGFASKVVNAESRRRTCNRAPALLPGNGELSSRAVQWIEGEFTHIPSLVVGRSITNQGLLDRFAVLFGNFAVPLQQRFASVTRHALMTGQL